MNNARRDAQQLLNAYYDARDAHAITLDDESEARLLNALHDMMTAYLSDDDTYADLGPVIRHLLTR